MALISIPEIRAKRPVLMSHGSGMIDKSASRTASRKLEQFNESVSSNDRFDIFLSHSYTDAQLVLDLKNYLETFDLKVYVDWATDKQLDRTRVSKQTASILRNRMQHCRSLLFATSDNTCKSVWMPWELGYFDALRGRCAIIPLMARQGYGDSFIGQEYLGLYPYVTRSHNKLGIDCLWVRTSAQHYVRIDYWLNGQDPQVHN